MLLYQMKSQTNIDNCVWRKKNFKACPKSTNLIVGIKICTMSQCLRPVTVITVTRTTYKIVPLIRIDQSQIFFPHIVFINNMTSKENHSALRHIWFSWLNSIDQSSVRKDVCLSFYRLLFAKSTGQNRTLVPHTITNQLNQ